MSVELKDHLGDCLETDPPSPGVGVPYDVLVGDGTIVAAKIGAGAVTNTKLGADAVDSSKIADNAIGTEHLQDSAVTANELATDAVTNAKVAANAIDTAEIVNGAVTNAKLGADAVDSSKVADNAIGTEHLQDSAVTANELATDAVTNAKVAANAIDTAEIVDSAVTNAKAADMATQTIKGRTTAGTGDPEDLTPTQVLAMLGVGADKATWNPNREPVSPAPHSKSDWFRGSSIGGGWTGSSPSSFATFAIDTGRKAMKISGTGNGTDRVATIHESVPAGSEYAVIAPIKIVSQSVNLDAGIFVASGPPSGGAGLLTLVRSQRTGSNICAKQIWTNRTTFASAVNDSASQQRGWMRFGVNGTNYVMSISADGKDWWVMQTGAIGFTPTVWGLCANINAVTPVVVLCDSWQVFEGAGTSDVDGCFAGSSEFS